MDNTDRKAQIYLELRKLVSAKRRQQCNASLFLFIDQYLKTLTPAKRPQFHDDMLYLMQYMLYNALQRPVTDVRGSGSGNVLNEGEVQAEGIIESDEIDREGGGGPEGVEEIKHITPPHFFPKISTSSNHNTQLIDSQINRLLFIAPRGFAKSTLCSVMFPLWLACYGKRKDIFLVSATISLAKELLRKIRNELELNEKIKEDFGDLKSDKWTEDMLVLSNGTILRAKGRGFQIRGFRPDMIICDDLEDEEVLYSKEQREKMETWFFRTLLPALKPDQGLLYVGTKLHQMALIGKLQAKEEFTSRHFKALTDGKSIWEEYWPTDRLVALRNEIGTYAFEAEYQNNPLSLEDQPIKPHYLEGVRIGGSPTVTCLAIDPAISEKTTSDPRAFVLIGRHEHGFKEIFSEQGRWGVDEQVQRILNIYERYQPDRIVIEEVAFQKVFRKLLIDEAKKRKIFLPISEAVMGKGDDKRSRDKVTRLIGVSHLFEQKLVEVVNPDLREQLIAFPSGDHDDLVDACVYALGFLMNYRSGKFLIKKEQSGHGVDTKKSFYMHEVRPGVFEMKDEVPRMKNNKVMFLK